ncbi:MAG: isoprenoid biosynthesis glyoxalase ElbB [Bacteroidales bacterium]|jgi:enhancing lycopene biosynthesis protein 2|nr:isoprenoid biosynthesis glyoxalase ElbB [Bacteroidales bacterium]MDD3701078.1 isoprenoid biosynthesis glyoxalase ElbB [Bacteroidales bacterium]MDY0369284.1 isoprenoid biosynthesis glyoxalase ElbB [Bacteroidales bacterium]
MKKFAVVLAGSGVYDGAEIHEATLAMLAIDQAGASYQCFAPDIPQHHVINHLTGEEMPESRNVLIEAARIARGNIKDLAEFKADDYDVLLFPGGFGAAKNLSTVAFDGPNATVNPEVEAAVKAMHSQKKPIAAMCISPVFVAKILQDVTVTIGSDQDTIDTIEAIGATHSLTDHGDVVFDEEHLVFTTPCYMLQAQISDIWDGASNIVDSIMEFLAENEN